MSVSSTSRVKRGPGPKKKLNGSNYRRLALPFLVKDFRYRCAYCMDYLGDLPESSMHIDHFDPKSRSDLHKYANLFLADGGCNLYKGKKWPSSGEKRKGLRFLDCCREHDYEFQIFEDEKTHELVGVTPAAKYHISMIGLNAPHLIKKRAYRAKMHEIFNNVAVVASPAIGFEALQRLVESYKNVLDTCIPLIRPPP